MGGRALPVVVTAPIGHESRSRAALAAGAVGFLMSVLVVALHQANSDVPFRDDFGLYSLTVAAGSMLYVGLGAVILWRRPRHPIGLLFVAIGLAAGLAALCREYTMLGVPEGELLPGASWAWWLGWWIWFPGYAIRGTLLLVIFPDGRPPSRGWWPLVAAVVALIAVDAAYFAITPFQPELPGALADLTHPLGIEGERPRLEDVFPALPLAYLGVTLACIAALVHRLVRSRGEARLQISWFALGALLWVGAAIVDAVTHFSQDWVWAELLFIALPAVGATIGIVRHDLYDIRRAVHRGVVLIAMSAAAVMIYGAVVVLGQHWFGRASDDIWVAMMAVTLIAAAALPLLRGADRAVKRLLYGEATDPLVVLSRLTGELNAATDPGGVLDRAVDTIRRSLRLPYVRIEAEGLPPVEAGSLSTDTESIPLIDRDVYVGALFLGRRAQGEAFRGNETQLLDDLAARLASTVSAIRLGEELANSREALVIAREEERRRIRHDLHDGLGPQLAGIGLQLDLSVELLERDPFKVARMLQRAKTELDSAIVNVRHVVDGLRPPALDELGLVGAIRQATSTLDASVTDGFAVSVQADDIGELPAAVEVAAFRIASEAATNAARHSGGSTCLIRLRHDGELAVVVEDNGKGVDRGARGGVGLSSMRQRAEELGGSLTVDSDPDRGTRIIARIPVP